MEPDLQAMLLADNPWLTEPTSLEQWLRARLPATLLPRAQAAQARSRWVEANRAHIVIGPRQSGKSTTFWAHLANLGKPVLFIDCEQALIQGWCRSPPLFLADLERLLPQPTGLFFDEVQHLEQAGLFLKGLVDRKPGVPILVTGSSSWHLGSRTRESLAGRATRTTILPLSFAEARGDRSTSSEVAAESVVAQRFARHVISGGYPEVWLSPTPELLLRDLVEAVILRDASDFFRIARPDAFRRLLGWTAGQVGSLVNHAEWASILGVSRDTVASYVEILESSQVVVSVPPFAGGRRSELTSRPKVYFVDNGIRNQLVRDFAPFGRRADDGPVLENWVFTELLKALPDGATLHFWRSSSGAEVDFVVARGDELAGVEVKAAALQRAALPRSARSFIDAYRPGAFLNVGTGLEHRERVGVTDVRWIRPPDLAAAIGAAFR